MSLESYLKMGGDIKKVDWSTSRSDYRGDGNFNKRVLSYEDRGDSDRNDGTQFFHFTFEDGIVQRYAICWIDITVELVLANQYLK